MTSLIKMTDIDKRFPGVHALKGVQFDLKEGEVHALMGENGAGKSTLMKILSGIYQADGGEIRVGDEVVSPSSPSEAQALGISIIHQELALMNDLTAAENIFIGREPMKSFGRIDKVRQDAMTREIFQSMHLNLSANAVVGTLTIAKQQMIEIAKALTLDARILIMDEPTAALNNAEIEELFTIINRLKSQGVGIVYISHKMDELKRISDRVTVMRDGEFVGTKIMADTPVPEIIQMMVGREINNEAAVIPDLDRAPVALEVRGLTRKGAIKDVSFAVKAGEILGFAGLMGAGRTEVARAIFGADPIDSGEILVHGAPHAINSPADAVELGIGYLSEDRKHFGLATGMTVRANVVMASMASFTKALGVLDEKAIAAETAGYVTKLGIKTPSDMQEVRFLSGGNQQKVVIAKWLLRHCDILIFDEPTRGIDVGAKSEIYALLEDLASQGRAIIVISSELPEVLRLSHRIAVMCEGRLTGMLPGGAETSQEQIMQLATQRETSTDKNRETS